MRKFIGALTILFLAAAAPSHARPSHQPVPRPVPQWDVSEWINGEAMQLSDLKGKVVVIDFFQLWCPGCNAFSIPLVKLWSKNYAPEIAAGRMQFVSIHTEFEGFAYQTPQRLKGFIKRKKIHHAVGVDRAIKGQRHQGPAPAGDHAPLRHHGHAGSRHRR
jgi:thiol-disulfide isomerase/thioredoxin